MRYLLLSLSTLVCLTMFSCAKSDSDESVKEMSARIRRLSADDTGSTWSANPKLVAYTIPYSSTIMFKGSDYTTNPTSLTIFVRDFDQTYGKSYPLYQGTAQQTDSNYAILTYNSRQFHTISGKIDVLRTDDKYIADFQFTARNLDDTIRVTSGHLNITR